MSARLADVVRRHHISAANRYDDVFSKGAW